MTNHTNVIWFDAANGTQKRLSHLVPTYYHLRLDCLRRRYPHTQLKDIILYDEMRDQLSPDHVKKARRFGILI